MVSVTRIFSSRGVLSSGKFESIGVYTDIDARRLWRLYGGCDGFGRPLMGDNRYTLRRSNPYRTMRNRAVPVRTPGNKLVAQYLTKRVKGMRCAATGKRLAGIPRLSTHKLGRLSKNKRTVARAYGGVFCGAVVKERIINAFMEEEARAVAEKQAQAEKNQARKGRK